MIYFDIYKRKNYTIVTFRLLEMQQKNNKQKLFYVFFAFGRIIEKIHFSVLAQGTSTQMKMTMDVKILKTKI